MCVRIATGSVKHGRRTMKMSRQNVWVASQQVSTTPCTSISDVMNIVVTMHRRSASMWCCVSAPGLCFNIRVSVISRANYTHNPTSSRGCRTRCLCCMMKTECRRRCTCSYTVVISFCCAFPQPCIPLRTLTHLYSFRIHV